MSVRMKTLTYYNRQIQDNTENVKNLVRRDVSSYHILSLKKLFLNT